MSSAVGPSSGPSALFFVLPHTEAGCGSAFCWTARVTAHSVTQHWGRSYNATIDLIMKIIVCRFHCKTSDWISHLAKESWLICSDTSFYDNVTNEKMHKKLKKSKTQGRGQTQRLRECWGMRQSTALSQPQLKDLWAFFRCLVNEEQCIYYVSILERV